MDPNNDEDNLFEALEHQNLLTRCELIFDWNLEHAGTEEEGDTKSIDVGRGLGHGISRDSCVYRGHATATIRHGWIGLGVGTDQLVLDTRLVSGLARGTARDAASDIGHIAASLEFSTGGATHIGTSSCILFVSVCYYIVDACFLMLGM
jgi:hypothetical protein